MFTANSKGREDTTTQTERCHESQIVIMSLRLSIEYACVCLPLCLSVFRSVYLSICVSLYLPFFSYPCLLRIGCFNIFVGIQWATVAALWHVFSKIFFATCCVPQVGCLTSKQFSSCLELRIPMLTRSFPRTRIWPAPFWNWRWTGRKKGYNTSYNTTGCWFLTFLLSIFFGMR